MNKLIEIKQEHKFLFIYWLLTDYCNFSCRYCPPALHAGYYANGTIPGKVSDEQIEKFVDDIINKHLCGNKLLLGISGGEPTTHKMFPYILEKLRGFGDIEITTNGSRPINWWKNLPKLPSKVIISLHPEFTDIKKINKVGNFLVNSNVTVKFNLMCDPKNWNNVLYMYNELDVKLKSRVIPFQLKHLEGDGRLYDGYTEEHYKFIKNVMELRNGGESGHHATSIWENEHTLEYRGVDPIKLIASKQNSFNGWQCSAGKDGISIRVDGAVFGGICKITKLGTIDNFNLLNDSITCNRNFCPCPGDISYLNKKRITND